MARRVSHLCQRRRAVGHRASRAAQREQQDGVRLLHAATLAEDETRAAAPVALYLSLRVWLHVRGLSLPLGKGGVRWWMGCQMGFRGRHPPALFCVCQN